MPIAESETKDKCYNCKFLSHISNIFNDDEFLLFCQIEQHKIHS